MMFTVYYSPVSPSPANDSCSLSTKATKTDVIITVRSAGEVTRHEFWILQSRLHFVLASFKLQTLWNCTKQHIAYISYTSTKYLDEQGETATIQLIR